MTKHRAIQIAKRLHHQAGIAALMVTKCEQDMPHYGIRVRCADAQTAGIMSIALRGNMRHSDRAQVVVDGATVSIW